MLQPASRRVGRHTSTNALKRFFAIADAWELSPLQQCRLLKIPSPQVLQRYRLGQAPRLSATQQERAALIANIQYSLTAGDYLKDRAWAWVHAPREAPPFSGDSPLYFMLENRSAIERVIDVVVVGIPEVVLISIYSTCNSLPGGSQENIEGPVGWERHQVRVVRA